MNHAYRSIWNEASQAWVAAPETARAKSKARRAKLISAAMLSSFALNAHALPTGGALSSGAGSIAQSGSTMTVTQASQNLAINWQSFNVGAGETANFVQPNASAIALNRVLGTDGSQILGKLNANGQVWILNPNGVLFGKGAQVNVGGLVASTLNISDADFLAGKRSFSGNGGTVTNQGEIAANYVALLGEQVKNEGVIVASLGTVAMAAGNKVTLDFDGDKLLNVQIDEGALKALAENRGLVQADGGLVVMTAKAKDALLDTAVNNTGIVRARTIENREGKILLLGDMDSGTVNVGGTLDASAPDTGDGGFVETSAAHVKIADGVKVSTKAAAGSGGKTGTWLIDPHDFTIAASGGDITGALLSSQLAGTDIAILSSSGASNGNGDIHVNDAVTWSANTLTFTAARDININAVMTAKDTAALTLNTGTANGADAGVAGGTVKTGFAADGSFKGRVDFFQADGVTPRAGTGFLTINGAGYTVLTDKAALQGMNSGLAGKYALGTNIDASGGFTSVETFTGVFDGLGHTVANLSQSGGQGLFGNTNGATLRNVGVVNATINSPGNIYIGGLVGSLMNGRIDNSYATGTIVGMSGVGGLAGFCLDCTIADSHASVAISGVVATAGGLVGDVFHASWIKNSYATGDVTGDAGGGTELGGLVGALRSADYFVPGGYAVDNCYATGSVSGAGDYNGGLLGKIDDGAYVTINNSHATGNVSGNNNVGGLVGGYLTANGAATPAHARPEGVIVANSYATGAVNGANHVGGLIGGDGINDVLLGEGTIAPLYQERDYTPITILNSHADGAVTGTYALGGLLGRSAGITVISDSYATGAVTGTHATFPGAEIFSDIGGLVGKAGETIGVIDAGLGIYTPDFTATLTNTYATGNVFGTANYVGGLAGWLHGDAVHSHATGNVNPGITNAMGVGVGGLAGSASSISDSYATGNVIGGHEVGGLAGSASSISNSYASGNVVAQNGHAGGLALFVVDDVTKSYFAGSVGASGSVATLVAQAGSVTDSYWNTDVNNASGCFLCGTFAAAGKTTAELQQAATFVGWNMDGAADTGKTWSINGGYPQLRGFLTPIYVAADNATKTYGAADPTFTYHIDTGSLGAGAAFSGNLARAAGENVGSYAINVGNLSAGANYRVMLASYADSPLLAISPASLTVSADNAAKTYDGLAYSGGTATYTGLVNGDTAAALGGALTFGGSSQGAVNVGTYTITASGLTSTNYNIAFADGTLTVNKAPLTVAANDASKTYDGAAYAGNNGVSYSGFVHGETSAVLGGALSYGGSSQGAVNAGTYAIAPSGLTSGNYALTYASGTLTVNKALLTVAGSFTAADKTYDGTTAAVMTGNTLSFSGLIGGDTATANWAAAFVDKNVGAGKTVNLSATNFSGPDGGNYTVDLGTAPTATANIAKAPLTVTANDATKYYDGRAFSGGNGVHYSGLVNNETGAVLGGSLAYGGSSQGATALGTYVIAPGGLTSGNYAIAYADGTLTIAAPLVPTAPGAPADGYPGALAAVLSNMAGNQASGGSTEASDGGTATLLALAEEGTNDDAPPALPGVPGFTIISCGQALPPTASCR